MTTSRRSTTRQASLPGGLGEGDELLELAASFDTLLEGAPLGIGVFDRHLRHVRVNPVLEEMNGVPAEALLGRTPSEVNGELGLRAEALYRQVMEDGAPMRDVRLSGEVTARPGEVRHWSTAFHPIRRDGSVIGLCVVVADITAEQALTDALAESRSDYRQLAESLQRDLLPPVSPTVPSMDVAARYRPAARISSVGGDFYDVVPLDQDSWLLVIGDVQGKGPRAASLGAAMRYAIRTAAAVDPHPGRLLSTVNDVLLRMDDDRLCTAAAVVVARRPGPDGGVADTRTWTWSVRSASAGHPLPLLRRHRPDSGPVVVEELGAPGVLLGALTDVTYPTATADLGPDDVLVLYTDGLTEARAPGSGPIELFGSDRLAQTVATTAGGSAEDVVGTVDGAVRRFSGGDGGDDLAVLVLRVPQHRSR